MCNTLMFARMFLPFTLDFTTTTHSYFFFKKILASLVLLKHWRLHTNNTLQILHNVAVVFTLARICSPQIYSVFAILVVHLRPTYFFCVRKLATH
jgi:hypothetical protein